MDDESWWDEPPVEDFDLKDDESWWHKPPEEDVNLTVQSDSSQSDLPDTLMDPMEDEGYEHTLQEPSVTVTSPNNDFNSVTSGEGLMHSILANTATAGFAAFGGTVVPAIIGGLVGTMDYLGIANFSAQDNIARQEWQRVDLDDKPVSMVEITDMTQKDITSLKRDLQENNIDFKTGPFQGGNVLVVSGHENVSALEEITKPEVWVFDDPVPQSNDPFADNHQGFDNESKGFGRPAVGGPSTFGM